MMRLVWPTGQQVGVDVTLELYADTVHSFVLFDFLPDTQRALAAWKTLAANAIKRCSDR